MTKYEVEAVKVGQVDSEHLKGEPKRFIEAIKIASIRLSAPDRCDVRYIRITTMTHKGKQIVYEAKVLSDGRMVPTSKSILGLRGVE